MASAGIKEQVDKHYQRFGLKLLVLPQVPEGSAYNIILKAPVGPSGDLQGRKIRATQSYAGVLSMLGASPVNLPPAEIYPSLEKGVVDGAAWPVIGPLGLPLVRGRQARHAAELRRGASIRCS